MEFDKKSFEARKIIKKGAIEMILTKKGIALFLRKNLLILSLIIIMIILGCVLNDLNESTITQCYDNSKNTFITVSIIEAAVDILEGVRIAGVDLGNVLHPVLDCLKILWIPLWAFSK